MAQNRFLLLLLALLVVIAVAVAAIFALASKSSAKSPQDTALTNTVLALKTDLARPGKLPVSDPTLQSFQAWVYNSRTAFGAAVAHEPHGQFAQIVFNDPNTMPPATLSLRQNPHPVLSLPLATVTHVLKSTDTQCGDTASSSGARYRFCAAALKTPSALRSSDATGLLSVFAPKK